MGYMGNKREKLKILVIVAHPHDFTHCSGTCGVHTRLGDEVTVVTLMSGAQMHNEKYHDELMKPEKDRDPAIINFPVKEYEKKKEQEFKDAVALFGVTDIRILHAPEPYRLYKSPEYGEVLGKIILDVRPDILITQSPYYDGNLRGRNGMANGMMDDHSQTSFAVHEGLRYAAISNYETKAAPHNVVLVLYMGIYFNRDQVDFYIDVTDWLEQRVKSEAAFTTQGHTYEFAKRRIETTVGGQGYWSNTPYSEGFVRSNYEVFDSIPISETSIKRAREGSSKMIQRIEGKKT